MAIDVLRLEPLNLCWVEGDLVPSGVKFMIGRMLWVDLPVTSAGRHGENHALLWSSLMIGGFYPAAISFSARATRPC